MKFIEAQCVDSAVSLHVLELSRRNLQALLDKLDDPLSGRGFVDPDKRILVRAVEDVSDAAQAVRGALIDPEIKILVRPVEDAEHYGDRPPGVVYMPSTGEVR